MAVIGIYKDTHDLEQTAKYTVEALHFNLWILPAKIGWDGIKNFYSSRSIYKYYIDIGMRLNVTEGILSKIDLHLPCFGNGTVNIVDQYDLVLDEKINDLLFGTKVLSHNSIIRYERHDKRISDTVLKVSGIEKVKVGGGFRHRLSLTSSVEIEDDPKSTYLRFRFKFDTVDEILLYKGWGFAKRGFIVDFRVNDLRETVEFENLNQSMEMSAINEVNLFIVCPTNFLPMSPSPEFHYSRLREPSAWDFYLQSCQPFRKSYKFSIHQWKQDSVTYAKPFRGYVHLHKEFGWMILMIYLAGLFTPIAFGLIKVVFTLNQ